MGTELEDGLNFVTDSGLQVDPADAAKAATMPSVDEATCPVALSAESFEPLPLTFAPPACAYRDAARTWDGS